MNSVVLYRKYRPKSFDEVLGQDHIVSILKNAVKLGRVSHAYLFAGSRGTGKTSVARILANEIECADVDLIEIDAASSRGIDEIRALREAVRYVPLQGKVKVYIIDEVHMLTKEAFNALLKTLEEPPEHAIFVLATTEIEKVPDTIISRCQNFSFKKIPESLLRKSISSIVKKEGFEIDDEAAGLIALFAEGSFRDSQSILDQILSLGSKKIDSDKIREFLSVPSRELTEKFIISLIEKKLDNGIEIIQKIIEQNIDIKNFLKMVLRDMRLMILLKSAPDMKKKIEEMIGEREFEFIEKYKDISEQKDFVRILSILLDVYDIKSRSYLPQLPLELALLKIISQNE